MRALTCGLPRRDGVAVFASVYPAVTEEERLHPAGGRFADRTVAAGLAADLAGAWSLERARDAAWAAARVLWRLRGLPEVGEEFAERLDQSVGLVSRCLLAPLRARSRD